MGTTGHAGGSSDPPSIVRPFRRSSAHSNPYRTTWYPVFGACWINLDAACSSVPHQVSRHKTKGNFVMMVFLRLCIWLGLGSKGCTTHYQEGQRQQQVKLTKQQAVFNQKQKLYMHLPT